MSSDKQIISVDNQSLNDDNQPIKEWFAVYTAPRAEKKASERWTLAGIEHYLPLQKVKRQWSDRVKEVEVPVVNGYIFVRVAPNAIDQVLKVYGIIAFVKEFHKPVAIPDKQLAMLRFMVESSLEPVDFSAEELVKGETIRVVKGELKGIVGELVNVQGKHKVVIRINKLGYATTTVSLSNIQRG
jgi:transcription termination/antitermination protein NusG